MEKKIDIGKEAKVSIVWNVMPVDYSKEKEKSIIALMAKKYEIPESHIRIEPNFIAKNGTDDISLNSENIQSIQDPKFQQSLFEPYLKSNNITDYDMDEIVKIDSQINNLINYDAYEKSKRYSIKWVKWSNFLSYGPDNYFDFTTLKGLILLNGIPANESGKSTFAYDLLHYLLFGKIQSDKAAVQGQLFNNYLPDATVMSVEGCIVIDGKDYIIKRTLTRPDKKKKNRPVTTKVEYYCIKDNGDMELLPDAENLQAESTTQTSKVIKEALGNETDFDRIISANAKDLDSLISLKDTERGRLLSRWIGLSVLEDKDAIAREKWNKEISKKRYCDIYNETQLTTDIEELEKANKEDAENIDILNKRVSECNKKISEYEDNRNTLLTLRKSVDESLCKIDITTLESQLTSIIENGKRTKEEIKTVQSAIAEMGEISVSEDEYMRLTKLNESHIEQIAQIKAQIQNLKLTNKNLASAEYCPTCGRKFDNVDNSAIIKKNQETIDELIKKGIILNDEKVKLGEQINKINDDRIKFQKKTKLEIKLSALNTDLANQRADYRDKDKVLKAFKDNETAIKENNLIDTKMNVINDSIKTEEKVKNEAAYNVISLTKDIENNKSKITEKKAIIATIKDERKTEKNWKIYLQLIGKNGIGKMVLRNTLPIINGEMERLLNDVADFDVEVSINDKNDVEFWLLRDGVKTRLSAASGLERTEAALALRVVLGKMSRLSRPPFILLDEILGTVAKESYDNMKRLYDKIVKEYDFVLHITHLDLEGWHDKTITIVKENNISRIK